jgi:aspartate aminotransferase
MKQKLDKEYLPITGLATFASASAKLAFGDQAKPIKDGVVRRRCRHIRH